MGNIPAGYVPLGLVGFTDRASYDQNGVYMQNDLVHVENSIWKCKIDNTQGIAPAENANWTIFINSSTELDGIAAVDTKGVLGSPGGIVVSQALIDAIAKKVMEDLVPYSKIVNNLLTTDTNTALSGPMGKQLKDDITSLNSDLSGYGSFLSTGADLNTLKTGVYFFNGYGTFTGTKPFTDKFGMFLCAKPSEGTRIQAAISDAGELKVRVFENAAWKPWK